MFIWRKNENFGKRFGSMQTNNDSKGSRCALGEARFKFFYAL